jgi:hypothetical protein
MTKNGYLYFLSNLLIPSCVLTYLTISIFPLDSSTTNSHFRTTITASSLQEEDRVFLFLEEQQRQQQKDMMLAQQYHAAIASSNTTHQNNETFLTTTTPIGNRSNDSHDPPSPPRRESVDIIIMVMGEARNFQRWHDLWNNYLTHEPEPVVLGNNYSEYSHIIAPTPDASKLSFVYASYDKPVTARYNETNSTSDFNSYMVISHSKTTRTIYMPGSTWTQARNKLAEEALLDERRRGRKYDYWVFLDDDVEFHCRKREGGVLFDKKQKIEIGQICWNRFLDFLNFDELIPQKATLLTVKMGRKSNFLTNYGAVSNADPFVTAFKRDSLQYHLPYATLREGMSEHNSAYVQYCLMFTCMKQSALYIPHICGKNNDHRPYTRGFNTSEIAEAAVQNYGPYLNMQHCDNIEYYVKRVFIRAPDALGLDLQIPSKNETCDSVKYRFYDWEAKVLSN